MIDNGLICVEDYRLPGDWKLTIVIELEPDKPVSGFKTWSANFKHYLRAPGESMAVTVDPLELRSVVLFVAMLTGEQPWTPVPA